MIGKGQATLTTFCGMMDLPPPICQKSYSKSNELILKATEESVREQQVAAAQELHDKSAAGTLFVPVPLIEADSNSDSEDEDGDESALSDSDQSDDDDLSDGPPDQSDDDPEPQLILVGFHPWI